MKSGGDPVSQVRSSIFFGGCSESEIDFEESSSPLRRTENGNPLVFGIAEPLGSGLSDGAARNIARQIGRTIEEVQDLARTSDGIEEIKRLTAARPQSSGGCGGGGRSLPDFTTGPSGGASSNGTAAQRVSIDVGLLGVLLLIAGRIVVRALSVEAAAASMLLGIAFPPPPEA